MRVVCQDVPGWVPAEAALTAAGHTVGGEPEVLVLGLPGGSDEERLLGATHGVYETLLSTPARGVVLLGSLRVMEAYDERWAVDERWVPRPSTEMASLAPFLAEHTAREVARDGGPRVWVMRLDEPGGGRPGVHPDDAASLLVRVVERLGELGDRRSTKEPAFSVVHATGGGRFAVAAAGRDPFSWQPAHPRTEEVPAGEPEWPSGAEPITVAGGVQRVTMYGAGGPLGVATTRELVREVTLTATDLTPFAALASREPQAPGAPLPESLPAPHEERVLDITVHEEVLDAARGADCLVNTSVVREDVKGAFLVNLVGAWNVMRAAVELGIPRVVLTGPTLQLGGPLSWLLESRVPAASPPKPGAWAYSLSKHLGLLVCRVLAEHHRVAAPALLFTQLHEPTVVGNDIVDYSISWRDAGRAVAAATRVQTWPEPSTHLDVSVPNPYGWVQPDLTWQLLGIEPEDSFADRWAR